uniref:Uncharacterized protein n=1 Tax=Anopheles merus TaxID=30066 RepID=A0A182VB26_ANOME
MCLSSFYCYYYYYYSRLIVESPESLIRYRLLSEPEIVNLLSSNPSGGVSEAGEQPHPKSHDDQDDCPPQPPPPSLAAAQSGNRCSRNSYDAGSSSDGSPTGVENNGCSSTSGTSSSSSSGEAGAQHSRPGSNASGGGGGSVTDVRNCTQQTSPAAPSNMVEV